MSDRKSINNHENETLKALSLFYVIPLNYIIYMYVILNLAMFNCLIEVF